MLLLVASWLSTAHVCAPAHRAAGSGQCRSMIRAQFENEKTDRRAQRQEGGLFQTPLTERSTLQNTAQSADAMQGADLGVQRGVRILGFIVGGLTGNVLLSAFESLDGSSGGSSGGQTIRAPGLDDSGLYRAVLPLVEDGTIPSVRLPAFINSINEEANKKYEFSSPPPVPPNLVGSAPEASDGTLAQLSSAHDTGSSVLAQLATLSPLPQPAAAASIPPISSYGMGSSALDDISLALAGDAGPVAHLLVPLVFGALGALALDQLAQAEGGDTAAAAAAVKKAGALTDEAAQKLVALVQAAVTKVTGAAALGNTNLAEPTRARRMPWEED